MAIQVDVQQTVFGVSFSNAYARIVNVNVVRLASPAFKFRLTIDVCFYASQPENSGIREIEYRRYDVSLSDIEAMAGDTFISKCYAWVMAQPDMDGSVSV